MAFEAQEWHEGENRIHELTGIRRDGNPNAPFLTPRAANMVQRYSLLALGTLDEDDNIWCTVWGGQPPFMKPLAQSILAISTRVDASHDPVVQALFKGKDEGEVIKTSDPGPMIGGLSIHLEVRGRVKLYGRMIAGALSASDGQGEAPNHGKSGEVQLVVRIDQSLGNCPKYLNKKFISSHEPSSKLSSTATHLTAEAIGVIRQADLFFVASAHAHEDMDCNHRGGPPGFIRVYQPQDSLAPTQIVWPEYSGNNLYQTLGNLIVTPKAGIVVPNFDTGDVLYLTGEAQVLVGADAARVIAKSKLAVSFTVTAARLVENGLPFRGKLMDDDAQGRSPYNPRIRYLETEKPDEFATAGDATGHAIPQAKAKLIRRTTLTPTINRYRFALDDPKALDGQQKPGQYVALDFSEELDLGYSHMRDDDPTSLNDDYLRTFTVSSAPDSLSVHNEEFEITVRSVGPVTNWLRLQREGLTEVGVRGFGGDFVFDQSNGKRVAFVAAGIGITPLLGQVANTDVSRLKGFWSLSVGDVGLLIDTIKTYPQLKEQVVVFLTGQEESGGDDKNIKRHRLLQEWQESGWNIHRRRITKVDLTTADDGVDQWYICTAATVRQEIQQWLPARSLVYENFDY
ncbi:hypothetical protein DV736_g4947, partial [Chaetothyriales sp. CBS 134916]